MRISEVRTKYTFLRDGEYEDFNFLEDYSQESYMIYIYSTRVGVVTGCDLYFNFTRSLPVTQVQGLFISHNIRCKMWLMAAWWRLETSVTQIGEYR